MKSSVKNMCAFGRLEQSLKSRAKLRVKRLFFAHLWKTKQQQFGKKCVRRLYIHMVNKWVEDKIKLIERY